MRKLTLLVLAALAAGALLIPAATSRTQQESTREYVVVYESEVSLATARAAVERIGGTIVKENRKVGVATVRTSNDDFVSDAVAERALFGAASNRPVGTVGPLQKKKFSEERLDNERRASMRGGAQAATATGGGGESGEFETFAPLQWDMQMIGATKYESHDVQPGERGVRVGILDTGIDGSHPDIAPNFDGALSRNFTTDIPSVEGPCEEDPSETCEIPIDGPCADEPDGSCSDPADVDENGHGTHVAGTVGAAVNGLGIAGVAPEVTLINIRAGQDSGYFFLQPSVDALTYAADIGVDVVNMSYYIDPWLFNCRNNPADSPEAQAEQRTIIAATQRALTYAHRHGVTLIAAAGNGHQNFDRKNEIVDETSPDFPPGVAYPREITRDCLDLPTEGRNVISVTAVGPSTRKAYYSDYGRNHAAVSAPGGDFFDYPGTPRFETPENLILSAYPENVAREFGEIDENGDPTTPFVLKDCEDETNPDTCAYWTYFQGTSMASPHAVGVAALIVSEHGRRDGKEGGLRLSPKRTERHLYRSASDHACPQPRLFSYEDSGIPPEFDAFCAGGKERNGFYGHGIVDAYAAVLGR
ncbi:MAG TPA: S8 family serine peptidase [Gaiellaceae bacterium]|nr:S8 family serine peptidase [Gaiellaceae bacterium]